ncbi:MAG: hypothetical protein KAH01_00695, partial [Caldisericia bacterium]|nr:hypothetical protein [Caldisericia bacterium]
MKKIIAIFLIFAVVVSLHSISSFGSEDSEEYSIQPRGFVAFELDGKTVTPFKTYQYVSSKKVTEAIKNVPDWLQNELFTTFENLDLCPIQTSDKSRPSFGDINADGLKDLVVIDQKGIVQVYLDQNFTYQLCLKKDISFTIDLPEEEEEEEAKEDLILPITPSLFDFNKDKKSDLFYGLENKIFYCENTSTKDTISFKDPELIYQLEPQEIIESSTSEEEEEP